MEEFVVYILYSASCGKRYVGFTSDLLNRMRSHNFYGKGYTARCRPWRVVHVEFYQGKKEAMQREKFLKTGVGRDWIRSNIDFNL